MTVGEKLHQCLAQSESVHAQLKSFALDTQDQAAKQAFAQMADAMETHVVKPLRARVSAAESEEPAYRVFQGGGQQGAGQRK
ncbi:MAG: DUF1657 domain-containing protein [Bacillota bacterium]